MSFIRGDYIHFCFTLPLFFTLLVHSFALNQDGTLLLSFKYSVLSDPLSVLDNWNYDDVSPCSWTGVTCAQIGPFIDPTDMFRVISLVLPNSQLLGSIPEELGLIQHLRTLDLSNNLLNGTLPISLFNSSELQVLSLAGNVISGELPDFIPRMKGIQHLNLSDNALAGDFPEVLTTLQNLSVVSLRSNYFSGSIPGGFQFVQVLDLSSNMFNGTLSLEFGGENIRYLNLSYNKLSGSVSPEFVKKIPVNSTIDISFNNLTGPIPQSIALSNQKTESFAGNADLCGKPLKKLCIIPSTLSTPPNVTVNGTSSPAIAAIPKTIDSTPEQNSPGTQSTAEIQTEHGLKPGTIAGIAVGDLAGIGLLAMVILYVYQLKKKNRDVADAIAKSTSETKEYTINKEPTISKDVRGVPTWSCLVVGETSEATSSDSDENNSKNGDVEAVNEELKKQRSLVMVDGETELEIETLLKASAYVLGSSGQSIVYKAVLEDGTAFAVRRIGDNNGIERLKEFEGKVRAIDKLRHPNLVRVRGFHWGVAEKLVIYDYVSNGSLAGAGGYKRIASSPCRLSLETRLKIARGVARGLTYIHEKKRVHGNIKPANILLTPDMEPVISDFGLHWLLSGKQCYKTDGPTRHLGSTRSISSHDEIHDILTGPSPSTSTTLFMGCTSPYHAPESLKSLKPNPKWDVYSFGIVLLELLTGKVFSDRELGARAAGSLVEDKNRVLRMADAAIRGEVDAREDAALACFKLGFSCASLVPQKRPSMKDALQVLEKMTCS